MDGPCATLTSYAITPVSERVSIPDEVGVRSDAVLAEELALVEHFL
jgi:hypothetical protein